MKVARDEWRAQARSGERYRNGDRDRYEEDTGMGGLDAD